MNGREIDRGHSWTADPNWPKKYRIPYNVIYTQQYKLKVEKERGGGGGGGFQGGYYSEAGWVSVLINLHSFWEVVSSLLFLFVFYFLSSPLFPSVIV